MDFYLLLQLNSPVFHAINHIIFFVLFLEIVTTSSWCSIVTGGTQKGDENAAFTCGLDRDSNTQFTRGWLFCALYTNSPPQQVHSLIEVFAGSKCSLVCCGFCQVDYGVHRLFCWCRIHLTVFIMEMIRGASSTNWMGINCSVGLRTWRFIRKVWISRGTNIATWNPYLMNKVLTVTLVRGSKSHIRR